MSMSGPLNASPGGGPERIIGLVRSQLHESQTEINTENNLLTARTCEKERVVRRTVQMEPNN